MSSCRSLISAIALAASSTACSFTFVTPPPSARPGYARPRVDCTTSYLWPAVDSALAAYQLVGVGVAAGVDEARYRNYPISKEADLAIGSALAALFVSSAAYGYVSAGRCRDVHRGPAPGGYVPGVSWRGGP